MGTFFFVFFSVNKICQIYSYTSVQPIFVSKNKSSIGNLYSDRGKQFGGLTLRVTSSMYFRDEMIVTSIDDEIEQNK